MARTVRAGALLVAVLGLFGACSSGDGRAGSASVTSPPRPANGPSVTSTTAASHDWSPDPLVWGDCDLPRAGECARLAVPLDWDRPDGAAIELALGRLRATGDSIGPLLVNPGGPGGSGLEFLAADPVSEQVAERFDVVSWDPRGVGASADLRCGSEVEPFLALDPEPDDDSEQAELEDAAAAVAAECAELDGEVLAHLGTQDVARDMEAIRRALGVEQLSYLGFSYGTSIGQEYLALFPDRVRAMVLDGLVDPTLGYADTLIEQARAFDAAFEVNAAGCARAGVDRCGVADLGEAYDRVAEAVERTPLPGGERAVGPAELSTAAIQTGYGSQGWQQLGPALAAALQGDGLALWNLAAAYYGIGDFTSYAAVVCVDDPPPQGTAAYREFARAAAEAAPRFGAAVANELAVCADWPADARPAPPPVPDGTPPVLVVGNTGDPATPYRNAVAVAQRLPGSALLTVESDGHTAYLSDPCAGEIVDEYLIDLVLPTPGSVCD